MGGSLARWGVILALLLQAGFISAEMRAAGPSSTPSISRSPGAVPGDAALKVLARLPIRFESNAGQTPEPVKFLARGVGYSVFITPTETVFRLGRTRRVPDATRTERSRQRAGDTSVLRMTLRGANREAEVLGVDPLPGQANYFVGSDPRRWRTGVPEYAKVRLAGVYPGVDLTYYGTEEHLESDFVISPGTDPNAIVMEFSGEQALTVDKTGDLIVSTASGPLRQTKPYAYQTIDGTERAVACRFVVSGHQVRFAVGAYDPRRTLIIDPVLAYSTFFGGSDDEEGFAARFGPGGDMFIAGYTGSANFPTAAPEQPGVAGFLDGFVLRLNAAGSALVYSTYVGGGDYDTIYGLALDASGNAYATGQTGSVDFPVTPDAYQPSQGGAVSAIFVKLNALGQLEYSTYLGGSGFSWAETIGLDAAGNVFIGGLTYSPDFPTTPGAAQPFNAEGACPPNSPGLCEDGFIAKFAPPTALAPWSLGYSTYLGGRGEDWVHAIDVDAAGNVYATGETTSDDFPITPGATQPHRAGLSDAFFAKIDPTGTLIEFSTYFGGTGNDIGRAVKVDSTGSFSLIGSTLSTDLPVLNALQPALAGREDVFIGKWTAGGAPVFVSYFGGSGRDLPLASAVDSAGNIYFGGYTDSFDLPTKNAFQYVNKGLGGYSAFVAKVNAPASTPILAYSSYLGGFDSSYVSGMGVNTAGAAIVTGITSPQSTSGGGFPLVNAIQPIPGGSDDAFIARLEDPDSSGGGGGGGGVGGECGNVSAQDALQSVLDVIVVYRPSVTDPHDGEELDDATKEINKALKETTWSDQKRPRKHPRRGSAFFAHDGNAAKELTELIDRGHGSVPDVYLENWITGLVQGARAAACQAIENAAATDLNKNDKKKIAEARTFLARGDVLASTGDALKAIEEYEDAWQKAIVVKP